jgi:hypothetical protein
MEPKGKFLFYILFSFWVALLLELISMSIVLLWHGSTTGGEVMSVLFTGVEEFMAWQLKLKLIYDQQSVGQSVLVSGTHLGPTTNFSFSLKFSLDSCGFVIL